MRILVSGGTGFIGSHVVGELLTLCPEATIRILSRRAQIANRWGPRVEYRQGNVSIPATLVPAASGVDAVVHCLQFPNYPLEDLSKGWTYPQIDGKGTQNIVEACVKAGVRRFVFFSRAGIGPARAERWLRSKWVAEEAIKRSGMEYVILRPSWIYGPGDKNTNRLIALVRHLPVVPVIGVAITHRPVSVFDVRRTAALSVIKQEAANCTFELGGPQDLTIEQMLRAIQEVLGKRRPFLQVPPWLARIAAGLISMLPRPWLSPAAVDLILTEEKVDPRPAEELFGLRFEDIATGLRRCL